MSKKRRAMLAAMVVATAALHGQEGERVPSYLEVQGTEVVGCRNNWEYVSSNVKIPNGITIIGKKAFMGFRTLVSIEIPASVKVIDDRAFADCESLENVTIPNSVVKIGYSAFARCSPTLKIRYDGKKEQWQKINIVGDFAFSSALIYCTDGNIDIETAESVHKFNIPSPILVAEEYNTKREILDWYNSLGAIRTRTNEQNPATVIVDVVLGYKKDDKATSTEITQRAIELKDFLRRYFTQKTADELRPQNEENLRIEIRNAINDTILSSSTIKDVRFMQLDMQR